MRDVLENQSFKLFECAFGRAAPRANPSVRNVFKSRSRRDAVIRVSDCRVIYIVAESTFPFFHVLFILTAILNTIVQ